MSKVAFMPLKQALRSAEAAKNQVFISRALSAIVSLEKELSTQRINEATAEPTDFQMLVRALTFSPVVAEVAQGDPLAAARLRGAQIKKELVTKAGGLLTSDEVAKHLHISRQAVAQRRANRKLLSVEQGRRGHGYPSFQFVDGGVLSGLEQVLKALAGTDSWMQLAFLVGSNDRLNRKSPVELLRRGEIDGVLRAAASYGEQGAA